jgi:hypothetical protein
MGLKPHETDRLTPAEFTGLMKVWRRMHPRRENDEFLDAGPAAEDIAALRAAAAEHGDG